MKLKGCKAISISMIAVLLMLPNVSLVHAEDSFDSAHYGYVENEVGAWDTILHYSYSDGNWSDITYYDSFTVANYDGYSTNYLYTYNINGDESDTMGQGVYAVEYDGRDRGTLYVRSTVDCYGDVDDYLIW